MQQSILKEAVKTGERVAEQFTASKEAVTGAWDDTKHFVKRTNRSLQDLLGDAKYNIKRAPLRSMAIAFGAGAVVGVVISRSVKR